MTMAASLPYVDEHSIEIEADPDASWSALLRVVERTFDPPRVSRTAHMLGCTDTAASGTRPLTTGSALPGFQVETAEPPRELGLVGKHRFSAYSLIFRLEERSGGGTRLRAETRAAFPGVKGSTYRALVIGTRMHVLVTRRILTAVRRRAERA